MRNKLEKIVFLGHYLSSSRSEDEIFEMAMIISRDVLGYDHGIFRVREGETLSFRKGFGFPRDATILAISLGEGITGEAAKSGESILVPDTQGDTRFLVGVEGCRSELCVPIKYDGNVVGAINVESDQINFFSQTDLRLLETLASQIASALEATRLREELTRTEKLSVVGQMASSILHDIRNDIHQLKISSWLLTNGEVDQDRANKVATIITRAGDNIYGLIEDIFVFVKKGEVKLNLTPTPIRPLLESVMEQVKSFAPDTVIIAIEAEPDITLNLEERRFRRVLLNLCRNAVEAMQGGGRLTMHAQKKDDGTTITISDTGCGIASDYIKQMWQPLSTSGKENGTGLGMAIVQQIVTEHQLAIDVQSSVGEGTTFTITAKG